MMRKLTIITAILALGTLLVAGMAHSASFTYSDQAKQIRAGVILMGQNPPSSIYTFHVMNRRLDIKPSGWDFFNPLAPTHITKAVIETWPGLSSNEGRTVTKDMACYWGVRVDKITAEELSQFDVLLLPGTGSIGFRAEHSEKLRKFVDNGGVIWIDNLGGQFSHTNSVRFFIKDLRFSDSPNAPTPLDVAQTARTHSLVNRPFMLNWVDLNKIGKLSVGAPGCSFVRGASSGTVPDGRYFTSIIVDRSGNLPIVSAAQYGSGNIVVSGVPISEGIVGPVNPGYTTSGEFFMAAESEDLKLAYNIVSLGTSHTTFQKSPRHLGSSFGQIGAPLTTLWEFPTPGTGFGTCSSPAILDDVVFYVDSGGVLRAFELSPTKDRDGDGNPDDGLTDPPGAQYDELWNVQVGPASAPTAAYLPWGGAGQSVPVVFVTLLDGRTVGVNAATGVSTEVDPSGDVAPFPNNMVIPSPTYVDGTVFWADGAGRIHAWDFFRNEGWMHPADPKIVMGVGHSPTVGYYYDSGSGATEQVLYMARRGILGAAPYDGTVASYLLKVFNETLQPVDRRTQPLVYRVRTSNIPIRDDFQIYVMAPPDYDLVPVSATVVPGQPGRFELQGVTPESLERATVIADYVVNYKPTPPLSVSTRREIPIMHPKNPDGSNRPPEGMGITGSPAASKKDILYFGTENGSLYAVRDRSRGSEPTTVAWRWSLRANPIFGSSPGIESFGTPAVVGDMVYFAVNDGSKGSILALKADPVFSTTVGEPISRRHPVIVKQWDAVSGREMRMSSSTDEESQTTPRNVNFVINYDSGRITFTNFRSGSDDLTAGHGFTITYYPEGQDTPVDYEIDSIQPAQGDKWNNLVWYMNVGGEITSSPVVMGNILYVGLANGNLVSVDVGKITRSRTGPNELVDTGWALNNGLFWSERVLGASALRAAPSGAHGMLAVATNNGLAVLHNPVALMADGNRLVEMDTGGRVVWSCDATTEVTSTTTGVGGGSPVYGGVKVPFNRPSVVKRTQDSGLVVADTGNNRIVHIDTGGNILWQITNFVDPAQKMPAGYPLLLSRPTDITMWMVNPPADASTGMAYPEYHYLVADSGNYRVLHIVARFDAGSGKYRNELQWVSPTLFDGKRYQFVTARRTWDPQTDSEAVICVVTNEVKEMDVLSPGGAIIKFTNWGQPNESYTVHTSLPLSNATPVSPKFLRPTFFDRQFRSVDKYTDVVIADNKVFVVDFDGGLSARAPFTEAQYHHPDGPGAPKPPFAPAYAQVLPNGNILVTNKATWAGTDFKGEVVEIAYNGGTWEIVSRAGAMTPNSHGLRQPASAERPLY